MKTFHVDQYWSATPEESRKEYDWMRRTPNDHDANNDSMWCNNPEETAAFMETVDKPWVRSAFVDDAGIVALDDEIDLAFKVETHNHQSALEPFGGANTGVGGVAGPYPLAGRLVLSPGRVAGDGAT